MQEMLIFDKRFPPGATTNHRYDRVGEYASLIDHRRLIIDGSAVRETGCVLPLVKLDRGSALEPAPKTERSGGQEWPEKTGNTSALCDIHSKRFRRNHLLFPFSLVRDLDIRSKEAR